MFFLQFYRNMKKEEEKQLGQMKLTKRLILYITDKEEDITKLLRKYYQASYKHHRSYVAS